jgi:hypothetical protein
MDETLGCIGKAHSITPYPMTAAAHKAQTTTTVVNGSKR